MSRPGQMAVLALVCWIACISPAAAQTPSGPQGLFPSAPSSPPPSETTLGAGDVESNSGYIDSALPMSQLRLRFDSAYGNNRPSRAEFFYPQSGFPTARGPKLPENNVDYQELLSYIEVAYAGMVSAFVEVPVRWVNPDFNPNAGGLSDINAGFKWAFLTAPGFTSTFQLRGYFPTRVGPELGTLHYSVEPALLFNYRATEWLTFDAEARYWIPMGGTYFQGDVVRYGLGFSLGSQQPDGPWVTPVVEFVGWTVLSGQESVFVSPTESAIRSASGDTIVNVKAGLRFGYSDLMDLYVGYGHALTGDVWYRDIVRAELRFRF